jgi:diguanylate cyclase (GGDEF)-like protein/putative nucleotidyltransferase with HDIG domain
MRSAVHDRPGTDPTAAIARAVDALGDLPVLSGTVSRVIALADDPESSTGELVHVMEADEAFAGNLLRFANSAHHARPVRAGTIRQAVTLVGRSAVKRLALEAATYRFLEQVPGNGSPSRGHLHIHAVAVGACAAAIAERAGIGVDAPHLGGLLHDVGKLVMPLAFGEAQLDAVASAAPAGAARVRAEREAWGVDHALAGGVLAARWGLPPEVVDAVRLHHGGTPDGAEPAREVAAVQLANAIVTMVDGHDPDGRVLSAAMVVLGMTSEDVDGIAERVLSSHGAGRLDGLGDRVGRLEELARVDDLTGVLNRRAWLQDVRSRLAEGERGLVLVCDVDGFKAVNDTHGHRGGDLLLGEVARVLGRQGLTGRLGGDEFALWVGGVGVEVSPTLTGALSSALRSSLEQARLGAVTVSMGVAPAAPGDDLQALLEEADSQLYRRKAEVAQGRR